MVLLWMLIRLTLLAIGARTIWGSARELRQRLSLRSAGECVFGRIVGWERVSDAEHYVFRPMVRFDVGGEHRQFVASDDFRTPKWPERRPVQVLHFPADPSSATLFRPVAYWRAPVFGVLMGVVLVVAAVFADFRPSGPVAA